MSTRKIDISTYTLPVLNMGMRGLALAGRFGLALYLAKYISLADVGLFGLVTGAVSIMPPVAGWGLNYFLDREIIGKSNFFSGKMVRDRLAVTFISVFILLALAAPFVLTNHVLPSATMTLLAFAIIGMESVAFDMYGALISMGHPVAANSLLFVRSAAWVFPVAALGILVPEMRSLSFVFGAWLVGLIASFAATFWVLRGWPLRDILAAKIDTKWARKTARQSWLIYLSDLGIVGTLFLDRYVVDHFLGLSMTGVFTLYWSVANAVHALVNTGVIQIAYPGLVAIYNTGDYKKGRQALWHALAKVVGLGVALALIAGLCFPPLLSLIGKENIAAYVPVFWAMLAGICMRLVADLASFDLAARRLDRPWAFINMFGIFLAFGLSIACIQIFGLVGAGIAVIATHSILCVIRVWVLATAKPHKGAIAVTPPLDTSAEI